MITPGPKCYTLDELLSHLENFLVNGKDNYRRKRAEIRDLTFKYKDGKASERITQYIEDHFIRS